MRVCPVQSMKEYSDSAYVDEGILEFVGVLAELIRMVRACAPTVSRYYNKYLSVAHAAALGVVVDAVRAESLLPPDSVEVRVCVWGGALVVANASLCACLRGYVCVHTSHVCVRACAHASLVLL